VAALNLHPWRERDRIKARILVPFSLLLIFVVGGFLTTAYFSEQRDHENQLSESIKAVERLFLQRLENDSSLLQATMASIVDNGDLQEAFVKRDRDDLLRRAKPLFETLRRDHRITHFYFSGVDKVNFLRVHQPDRHGDVIDRITMLRAVYSGETARGIELGPLGTLTLRVVTPWVIKGRIVGYVELGEEIEHISKEIHRILNIDLLVLVYKKFLNPQAWKEGMEMLGHADDWKQFPSSVVVGRSMEVLPGSLASILGRPAHRNDAVVQLNENGKPLHVAFLPLRDVAGQEVGEFVAVRDMSGVQAAFWGVIAWAAIASVVVGSGVFAVFYLILDRVEQDYRRQREVEMQLSRVNEEHQKVLQVEKLSAVGLMIGEIAHQLNNPLVGVVNMAQLAMRDVTNPERMTELLGQITKAGKDCHSFVKRMLEFNKISSFERKPTNINLLIEETVSLYRQSDGAHHQIETILPDGPIHVDVDPVLIGHAVFNLLSNAGQASPADTAITVTLAPDTGPGGHDHGWRLAVRDHGPGLNDDIIEKIFTPFFTTRAEGTGLGLPVVQHVAILHEGQITAGNAPGGGADFALWLPDQTGAG